MTITRAEFYLKLHRIFLTQQTNNLISRASRIYIGIYIYIHKYVFTFRLAQEQKKEDKDNGDERYSRKKRLKL